VTEPSHAWPAFSEINVNARHPVMADVRLHKEIAMSKRIRVGTLVFLTAVVCVNTGQAQLKVQPEKENVVASKLDGSWEPEGELTRRLSGTTLGKLSFKSDAAIAAKIPAMYEKFLQEKQIYMAGVLTLRDKEHPFVLIEHKGNPHVVYFCERDGDPFGDAESFNMMLAVAKDKQNDLLFIGGDFNNQPFAAYGRAKGDGK
jgi:hypothetical protein